MTKIKNNMEETKIFEEILDSLESKLNQYKLKEVFDDKQTHGEYMHNMGLQTGMLDAISIVRSMMLTKKLDKLEKEAREIGEKLGMTENEINNILDIKDDD